LRKNATHVREEEDGKRRSFKGYERQMERRNEWRKSERDRMVMLGPRYLRQEGDKPEHREETDGRSPKEGDQLCNQHQNQNDTPE